MKKVGCLACAWGWQCRKLLALAPDMGAAKGRRGAQGGIKSHWEGELEIQRAATQDKGRGHTREGGREVGWGG